MKFYIGSSLKNYNLVNSYSKVLKDYGWIRTYDWVKNVNQDTSLENLKNYAQLEFQGILDSDIVIILLPAEKGAHIEFGMAVALNKKIVLCSSSNEDFSLENTVVFYEMPNVIKLMGTIDENLKSIVKVGESK
ncbi:MAG: hypothetical protein K2K48_05855 [Anaeroplasmataceae bacterium]|nr:hypothetical protein [Anaeroplasmataceae bacterium]MDE6414920.1 hypothetical protein [Anaeroplasmataceae bacterium]